MVDRNLLVKKRCYHSKRFIVKLVANHLCKANQDFVGTPNRELRAEFLKYAYHYVFDLFLPPSPFSPLQVFARSIEYQLVQPSDKLFVRRICIFRVPVLQLLKRDAIHLGSCLPRSPSRYRFKEAHCYTSSTKSANLSLCCSSRSCSNARNLRTRTFEAFRFNRLAISGADSPSK